MADSCTLQHSESQFVIFYLTTIKQRVIENLLSCQFVNGIVQISIWHEAENSN